MLHCLLMQVNSDTKRRLIYFVLLLGGLLLINFFRFNVDESDLFDIDLHKKSLIYTKHGSCRMECRKINKKEVNEILLNGVINNKKSDPNDHPCPTYAVEGRSNEGQLIRLIVADCDNSYKLVTAIDLENEYNCFCQ